MYFHRGNFFKLTWLLIGFLYLWAISLRDASAGTFFAAQDQFIKYEARDHSFSAQIPGYWKVNEERFETLGASFFGPMGEAIGVYFHRSKDPATDGRYYIDTAMNNFSAPSPITIPKRVKVAGRASWEKEGLETFMAPEAGIQVSRKRIVVMPMKAGYFVVEASCAMQNGCDWHIFDSFLVSFQPGDCFKNKRSDIFGTS